MLDKVVLYGLASHRWAAFTRLLRVAGLAVHLAPRSPVQRYFDQAAAAMLACEPVITNAASLRARFADPLLTPKERVRYAEALCRITTDTADYDAIQTYLHALATPEARLVLAKMTFHGWGRPCA